MKHKSFPFPIPSLTRGDLDALGFDGAKADDWAMKEIVESLALDFGAHFVNGGLESWAEHYGLPKKPEKNL
jgi:hypothetical protein